MLGGWEFRCVQMKDEGAGPFWGPIRGKLMKILINLKKSSSPEPPAKNCVSC